MNDNEKERKRPGPVQKLFFSLGFLAALGSMGNGFVNGIDSTLHRDEAKEYSAQLSHEVGTQQTLAQSKIDHEQQIADELENKGLYWLAGGAAGVIALMGFSSYLDSRDRRREDPTFLEVKEIPA